MNKNPSKASLHQRKTAYFPNGISNKQKDIKIYANDISPGRVP